MPKWSHSSEILVDQTAKQPEPQKKKASSFKQQQIKQIVSEFIF